MLVLKILAALVIVGVWLTGTAILRNGVPVSAPPGKIARISAYLTTNVAETRDDHPFAELRTRSFDLNAGKLYAQVEAAVAALGWNQVGGDGSQTLRAEVRTPLLGFTDDLVAQIVSVGGNQSRLQLRSVSRVGRGDLGANAGHILRLYEAVDRGLSAAPDND